MSIHTCRHARTSTSTSACHGSHHEPSTHLPRRGQQGHGTARAPVLQGNGTGPALALSKAGWANTNNTGGGMRVFPGVRELASTHGRGRRILDPTPRPSCNFTSKSAPRSEVGVFGACQWGYIAPVTDRRPRLRPHYKKASQRNTPSYAEQTRSRRRFQGRGSLQGIAMRRRMHRRTLHC